MRHPGHIGHQPEGKEERLEHAEMLDKADEKMLQSVGHVGALLLEQLAVKVILWMLMVMHADGACCCR